jgi:hypothetical protein
MAANIYRTRCRIYRRSPIGGAELTLLEQAPNHFRPSRYAELCEHSAQVRRHCPTTDLKYRRNGLVRQPPCDHPGDLQLARCQCRGRRTLGLLLQNDAPDPFDFDIQQHIAQLHESVVIRTVNGKRIVHNVVVVWGYPMVYSPGSGGSKPLLGAIAPKGWHLTQVGRSIPTPALCRTRKP